VALSTTERVARLAAQQDGLLLRQQVLAVGMTPGAVRHRLRADGPWQLVLPGVYASFTGGLQGRQRMRAALLYGGSRSMLSGSTACRLSNMRYFPDPGGRVDLLVPLDCKVSSRGFVRVRRGSVVPLPLHAWGGVPVAPIERAAIDLARDLRSLRDVRALLCEAVQRGLTTPERLQRELQQGASAGSALPRRALADVLAGCRSAPECDLRDLVGRSRLLPEPGWNEPLRGTGRPLLVPDACWPEAQLVVEVDSAEWHRLGTAPEATERRRARLAALGWRVIPVSPRRLREEPEVVLRQIEAAYSAGLAVAPRGRP
jgi:hypothetical protein